MSSKISDRLDKLHEFEREPVSQASLQGGWRFAGMYAGEHVAATEFVIGALFVSWGARTTDILYGLLIGNLLAVLSWALICAPIATSTRLTLYWYLRKVAGPGVTAIYNVLNAVLYCILAGAMITVAASAVRIAFGIEAQTGWIPTDFGFVLVVLGIGAVVTGLAIWGFDKLSQFAALCSPWLLVMFVAGALFMLPALAAQADLAGIASFGDFRTVADGFIWTGVAEGGGEPVSFWQIAGLAWICNIAMHLGLSDMAILRYARRASYGLNSAFGMFLGHYLAWICAGVMGAATAHALQTPLTALDSGAVALHAVGVAGAIAVVVAGWTTSNPTLYRAGLALQAVTPDWPRWKVTLVAGIVTTAVACFPFVFRELLGFVAIYGIVLAPIGGIVVAEHFLFPRLGLRRFWASNRAINWPAVVVWAMTSGVAFLLWNRGTVNEFFLGVPAWFVSGVLYTAVASFAGARPGNGDPDDSAEEAHDPSSTMPRAGEGSPPASVPFAPLQKLCAVIAVGSLITCLVLSVWVFRAQADAYASRLALAKTVLLWGSILYFIAGSVCFGRKPHQAT
jgi:cytosine permease